MALQIKLDELLIALDNARDDLVAVEEKSESDLVQIKQEEVAKASGRASTP